MKEYGICCLRRILTGCGSEKTRYYLTKNEEKMNLTILN